MITKLNKKNFDENIKNGLKLVEFMTSWCGYCKKQEEILKEMDKIRIGQVDCDTSPELAKKFGIQGFPTFILFKDGKEVEKLPGLHTKFDLMNAIMKYLK